MSNILKQLLEIAITASNVQTMAGQEVSHLTQRDEYKLIASKDENFAKKLVTAWDGDKREFDRSKTGEIETLFDKMLKSDVITKMSQTLNPEDDDIKKAINGLKILHNMSFSKKVDTSMHNDIWAHEKFAKESLEMYEALKLEVQKILSEDR